MSIVFWISKYTTYLVIQNIDFERITSIWAQLRRIGGQKGLEELQGFRGSRVLLKESRAFWFWGLSCSDFVPFSFGLFQESTCLFENLSLDFLICIPFLKSIKISKKKEK